MESKESDRTEWLSLYFILLYDPTYTYMTTGKTIALTRWTFVSRVRSLFFNMLSGLVIAFLTRSKHLLISWLQSTSQWFWRPTNGSCHWFHVFLFYLPWNDRTRCHDLSFWMLFHSFLSLSSIGSFFPLDFLPLEWYHLHILTFLPAVLIPAHKLSSPAFHMMYSAYKLNKQSDNTQPCCTPFPILNQSVPCPVLTFASWPTYRFLRRQVRWSGILTF